LELLNPFVTLKDPGKEFTERVPGEGADCIVSANTFCTVCAPAEQLSVALNGNV
jgi:hypothetical protein